MADAAEPQELMRSELARADELGAQVRDAYADLARRTHALLDASAALERDLEGARTRAAAGDLERQERVREIARLEGKLSQAAFDLEHAQQDAASALERLREAQAKRASADSEGRVLQARLADAQQEIATARQELSFARGDGDALRAQLVEAQARRIAIEGERRDLSAALASEREGLERMRAQAEQASQERAALLNARAADERDIINAVRALLSIDPEIAAAGDHLAATAEPASGRHARDRPEEKRLGAQVAAALSQAALSWSAMDEARNQLDNFAKELLGQVREQEAELERGARERDLALAKGAAAAESLRSERDLARSELEQSRMEAARAARELEDARAHIAEQDRHRQDALIQVSARATEAARLGEERDGGARRAENAEAGLSVAAHAIAALRGGGSERVSSRLREFQEARSGPGDTYAGAAHELGTAIGDRARQLAQELTAHQGMAAQSDQVRADLAKEITRLSDEVRSESERTSAARAEHERTRVEREGQAEQLRANEVMLASQASDLEALRRDLRLAQAELEGLRASGQAAGAHGSEELDELRARIRAREADLARTEAELGETRERVQAGEARLARTREEFQRMLEERDRTIRDKDQALDEHGARRADTKGLEAQVAALTTQLASANERVAELEAVQGIQAGAGVRTGDLARELKKLQGERDAMRDRQRQLESELADALSAHAETATQLDEKRRESTALREQTLASSEEERGKTAALKEEFRKLKEEVVGLRARLRRLTEGH